MNLESARCLNFTTKKGTNYVHRPITGYFERTVPEVWDYVFSSGDTIGATANHPFFSQDRQEYIPVGDLGIGERVKLVGERTTALLSKAKQENGSEKVYNLEVWKEHNFHVGAEGVLVHNSYWDNIGDYFNALKLSFVGKYPLAGKKWTHKVTLQDTPLPKEIDLAESMGEFLQEKIALTKSGSIAVDAISENGRIISMKIMDGLTPTSNINNLSDRISGAISAYSDFRPNGVDLKVEVWVRGHHATTSQVFAQWDIIKVPNINIYQKLDYVSKIFYHGPDGIIELSW